MDVTKEEFIKELLPGAIEGYDTYGILPSLTLAQAVLESGWGKHHIGNNLFGIKASPSWKGDTAEVWTTEYINGIPHKAKTIFRVYDSFAESVNDHSRLLGELPRYANVKEAKDYKEACHAVKEAGYATDPDYAIKLIAIIEDNGFEKHDINVLENHWANVYWEGLNEMGIDVFEKRFEDNMKRGEVMALLFKAIKWVLES